MTFQADTDTHEKSWGQQRAWCAQKEEACCHGCCTGASTGVRFGSLSPYYPLLLAKTLVLQPRSFMVYCELFCLDKVLIVPLRSPSLLEKYGEKLLETLEK